MSRKTPKSLSELVFRPGGPLAELARRAAATVSLVEGVRAGLPDGMGEQLRGVNLRDDGTLVVLAASSAWAARLRFEADALLAAGRRIAPGARRVEVRVAGPGAADAG
jgi:hypothetical protein